MGILFDKTMEAKRKFLIEELKTLNVTTSQIGTSLEQLSYEELKYELLLFSEKSIWNQIRKSGFKRRCYFGVVERHCGL